MKTKKASKTNAKSRIIFFAIALTYNLLLGIYLKDFFVLSPMLLTLYLLSALPTLFFVLKIRSAPMRAIVLVVLFLVMVMSIISSLSCRRLLPMLTFIVTSIEMMCFGIVDNSSGKDKLLTKICVLAVSVFTFITLLFSYNFVFKPEAPYTRRDDGNARIYQRIPGDWGRGCEREHNHSAARGGLHGYL